MRPDRARITVTEPDTPGGLRHDRRISADFGIEATRMHVMVVHLIALMQLGRNNRVNRIFSASDRLYLSKESEGMSTNIVVLLTLSALISGTAAVLSWMGGWSVIGAFVIYSLGGSMTLLLLAGLGTLLGIYGEDDFPITSSSDQST
jgi:hypothetical protein